MAVAAPWALLWLAAEGGWLRLSVALVLVLAGWLYLDANGADGD